MKSSAAEEAMKDQKGSHGQPSKIAKCLKMYILGQDPLATKQKLPVVIEKCLTRFMEGLFWYILGKNPLATQQKLAA